MCNEGFSLDFNRLAHDSFQFVAKPHRRRQRKKNYLIIGWRWTIRAKSEKLIYIAAWRVYEYEQHKDCRRQPSSVSETSTCKTHFAFLMIKDIFLKDLRMWTAWLTSYKTLMLETRQVWGLPENQLLIT